MPFLLVVVVEGNTLPQKWYFRDITRCNAFAYYLSTGKTKINKNYRRQENISAYCIPATIPENTKTWD